MIYIIPAYKETINDEGYRELVRRLKKIDKVKFLNLQIEGNSIQELCVKTIKRNNFNPQDIIVGFSMGGLIAYCLAELYPFKKLICNSLSPCLGGDLKKMRGWKNLGLPVEEMNKMQYVESLAKKTFFIIGKKENKVLIERSKKLAKLNKGRLIVANAGHRIYIEEIIKELEKT